ncbi:MAG: acyltransferase [Alphaproteobacteria bacterium]|nr:acyltransferase [Alphaproteobacteria bacterium]
MNIRHLYSVTKGLVIGCIWRMRGVRIADRIVVDGYTPEIGSDGCIEIGSRASFRGKRSRSRLGASKGAKLTIGKQCFVNSGVNIEATVAIHIGDHCLIGDEVNILDSNYHEIDEQSGLSQGAVIIGNNVWIGNRAIILPHVTIGDHSVIGAGSVVTKPIPPKVLATGNPAKVIRQLEMSDSYIRR